LVCFVTVQCCVYYDRDQFTKLNQNLSVGLTWSSAVDCVYLKLIMWNWVVLGPSGHTNVY